MSINVLYESEFKQKVCCHPLIHFFNLSTPIAMVTTCSLVEI